MLSTYIVEVNYLTDLVKENIQNLGKILYIDEMMNYIFVELNEQNLENLEKLDDVISYELAVDLMIPIVHAVNDGPASAVTTDARYNLADGKPLLCKVEEMEWLLRYGTADDVLENRLYIAHIVNLYREQQNK